MNAVKLADNDQWWDLQAAEYVLGSLGVRERRLFEKVLDLDTEARERVSRWQQRLDPLNVLAVPIAPPKHVWENVLAHITNQSAQNDPHHDRK